MSLTTLSARLQYDGGNALQRINKQKLRSLEAALKNDYQSRPIEVEGGQRFQCLINSKDLKSDYDKPIVSVPFYAGLSAGDTFKCLDDDTVWMVYLPYIEETAYLRAQLIRCRYNLDINGTNYWVYFQGSTETDLRWYIKGGVNFNELNMSGTIYIKNDKNTKNFFKRFTKIKIDGHMWEVQITDSITVPGVLELEVQEYYDNTPAELPEIKQVDVTAQIMGKQLVEQNEIYGYEINERYYKAHPDYYWTIENNPRVRINKTYADGRICEVKVEQGAIGEFNLRFGDEHAGYGLKVKINIEDPEIFGPDEVYPYSVHEYSVAEKDDTGEFWIEDNNVATILEQTPQSCKVEILVGKKNNYILHYRNINGVSYELPITIKSF